MVLKWELRVDPKMLPIEISQLHCDIMTTIYDQFTGDLDFLAPNDTVMTRDQIATHVHHTKYFKIHPKSNRLSDRKTYEIYHRVRSSVTVATIKRRDHVRAKLQAARVWLTEHRWPEDVQDIVDVGWLTDVNPSIAMADQVEREIREEIIRVVGTAEGRIPHFRCHSTTVKMLYNKRHYVARAVGVQCRRRDRSTMGLFLSKISQHSSQKMIFYAARHHTPGDYARAVFHQARYLDESRVVAIEGIPAIAMPEFATFLQERDSRIRHVWQTHRSETVGRFNLETTATDLHPLAKSTATDIEATYRDFLHSRPSHLPSITSYPAPPQMVSKIDVDRDDFGSVYTHDLSRETESTCCSYFSSISLSTLGSDDEDVATSFPPVGPSQKPPPSARSVSSRTSPPITYVNAVRAAPTPPTSDLTTVHTNADLHRQIDMLIQAQEQRERELRLQRLQQETMAKEIAALKALLAQAVAPSGTASVGTVAATRPTTHNEEVDLPPPIDRKHDQPLAIHHTEPPPQTSLARAASQPPPPRDTPNGLTPAELFMMEQLQTMASQIAQLAMQVGSHQGGMPGTLLDSTEAPQQTPPPKKSNKNATPSNVDKRGMKRLMGEGQSRDVEMIIANDGEEGEIPPRLS